MLNFSCKELSFLSSYLRRISSYIQAFYLATSDGFLATYRPHLATGCFPELAAVVVIWKYISASHLYKLQFQQAGKQFMIQIIFLNGVLKKLQY